MLSAMQPTDAITKLIQAGLTETEIGARIGVNQSTINRIRHGQVPAWPIGQALIKAAADERRSSSAAKQLKPGQSRALKKRAA